MILKPTRKAALLIESYFRSQKPFLHSRIFKLRSILASLRPKELKVSKPSISKQHIHSSELPGQKLLQIGKKTYRSRQGLGSAPSASRRNWGGSLWAEGRRDPSNSPGMDTLHQASAPDQWVAVPKQPRLGRSNPTGMSKILRWGFSGEGNLRTQGQDILKSHKVLAPPLPDEGTLWCCGVGCTTPVSQGCRVTMRLS